MSFFNRTLTGKDYLLLGTLAGSWYLGSMIGGLVFHFVTAHEWGWGLRSSIDLIAPIAGVIVSVMVPGVGVLVVVTAGTSLLLYRRALGAASLIGVVGFALSTYLTSMAMWGR